MELKWKGHINKLLLDICIIKIHKTINIHIFINTMFEELSKLFYPPTTAACVKMMTVIINNPKCICNHNHTIMTKFLFIKRPHKALGLRRLWAGFMSNWRLHVAEPLGHREKVSNIGCFRSMSKVVWIVIFCSTFEVCMIYLANSTSLLEPL